MLGPPSDSVQSGSRVETTLARNYLDPRFIYLIIFILVLTLHPKLHFQSPSCCFFFFLSTSVQLLHSSCCCTSLVHTSNIIFGD